MNQPLNIITALDKVKAMGDSNTASMPLVRIHGVNDVRLDTVPVPACGVDDVLVEVKNCGICGSDLGYIAMGGFNNPELPMPLGHEMSAVVTVVGEHVTSVAVGDRVVVNPMKVEPPIGNFGIEGGFAPTLLVRDVANQPEALLKIPDHLTHPHAALVEPLSVGMHAVHRGEVTANDKVAIFGAGTIGLSIALVLRYYGVTDTVIIDTSTARIKQAKQLGFHGCLAGEDDVAKVLQQYHGSVSSYGQSIAATDVYLEATGVASVFEQMISLAKMQARLVVVGVHKASASIDLVSVLSKELSIKGAMAYPEEFPEVLSMLETLGDEVAALITHHFPLSQFDQALAMARDTDHAIKVMIDCQK